MQISEIAQKYKITPDTLRYYERIGLLPPVTRSRGGNRDYSEEDERWVEFITCMRNAGLTIEVLIEYVGLFQEGDDTIETRKNLLTEQRDLLADRVRELQDTLNRLNYKIDNYEKIMVGVERSIADPQT